MLKVWIRRNGDALEVNGKEAHPVREFTSGEDVMVDGYGIGDVGSVVLKDRKKLSQAGLIRRCNQFIDRQILQRR